MELKDFRYIKDDDEAEHTWIRPVGLRISGRMASTVRRKRDRDDPSPRSINNKEGLSSPHRKQPSLFGSPGRQHSIFTLSSSNVEIAEEQCDIKGLFKSKAAVSKSKQAKDKETDVDKDNDEAKYNSSLCIDWSLKSCLRISTKSQYQWATNNLKSSEESSGISAFVRCIDIKPVAGSSDSHSVPTLDTSMGAQFHQCCLYWQYPHIPSVVLFPRDGHKVSSPTSFAGRLTLLDSDGGRNLSQSSPPSKLVDDKILQSMQAEWIDALRSSFHLLRLRQSPYFYICAATFTCLFCSAGARDPQEILAFITPSTKGFRDSLTRDGIKFETPNANDEKSGNSPTNQLNLEKNSNSKSVVDAAENNLVATNKTEDIDEEGAHEDNEDPDKWLDDMGISQDVSITTSRVFKKNDGGANTKDAKSSSLVVIRGNEVMSFFNFLINTRSILTSSSGPFAGIPPTILSLVAFHGATLKWLKVTEKKVKSSSGQNYNSIEMAGPILPHVPHMLSGLLSKTVGEYKIHFNTLSSTIPFNNRTKYKTLSTQSFNKQANAFALQSLTDCGLTKSVLDVFCQCDENCSTIKECLLRKNGVFTWY